MNPAAGALPDHESFGLQAGAAVSYLMPQQQVEKSQLGVAVKSGGLQSGEAGSKLKA